MRFHADLHVHSRFSRATSRDLDLEHLFWWAARKGVRVVGTGDCVHPGWLAEIRDRLVPEGNGLFRLRPEIEQAQWATLPASCRRPVSFMLSTEISTIYKKGDKTRKIHHLIYCADLAAVDRLAARLARIGNIASDGRPILGLDSRDLLEIALESGPDSYLVPAHIWTPWFAALGSQSGFDSIEECYGDLAGHIFAVETGLSSDPAMNWLVSSLDRFRLTSNSDAHSPGKLGREATRFACAPDYAAIRRALESGDGYVGTVEFFPEEGKYHMDGHRACGVRLDPRETVAAGGLCPVCGRTVTVGVAHRVESLADRDAVVVPPATAGAVASLVPLPEMLSEIVGSGVASKAAVQAYDRTVAALGPELPMLEALPVEEVSRVHPLLGEAVTRLRAGTVIREAGYDGEYGVIRLFAEGELDRLSGAARLFDGPVQRAGRPRKVRAEAVEAAEEPSPLRARPASGQAGLLAGLDAEQARAAAADGPLVVIAGPGAGKTRMLTHRLAHLVRERGVAAGSCLAVTFTRKATEELRARLAGLGAAGVAVHSFHSLGLAILRAEGEQARIAGEVERAAALAGAMGVTGGRAARLVRAVSVLKRTGGVGNAEEEAARAALGKLAQAGGWMDFDDLVGRAAALLETRADLRAAWQARFTHVVADEFQDVDEAQYRLLRLVAGRADLCVIGDPDQAIYGFRGADAACFARFAQDFPTAATLRLSANYRSSGTIVTAAAGLVGASVAGITRPMGERILLHVAADEAREASFVAATIEDVLGGHDLLAANRRTGRPGAALGFADCAVLYRTDAQAAALRVAFDRAGIPFMKSSPAPIAGHPGVVAILAALDAPPSPERIAEAAEIARRDGTEDAAALAEAKGWLTALAEGPGFAEAVALSTEADFRDARADRVSLLTMHAAKGLEFAVVFVVGMEAGLMPFAWPDAPEDAAREAEERRLFYVAMTRAKDRLFLIRAAERSGRGRLPPSPFLAAIPAALTATEAGPRAKARQFSLF